MGRVRYRERQDGIWEGWDIGEDRIGYGRVGYRGRQDRIWEG